MEYSTLTRQRAECALRCSPFTLKLFAAMQEAGVPILQIAGVAGVEQGYTVKPTPELVAESHLEWLIQVGLLRREVDGQGITDSFRLTPLGRQLIKSWVLAPHAQPAPTPYSRTLNFARRWLRLPV
ncbi:MAG: hypothetical protein HC838_07045 [Spirulinaceae cyanobacterium RM2_2_10]|nr:hypothetical protein [Spirulinaceae cyanobacterium SM2_1_0]NJO19863.1 hypothetical protein [Spirulinaceae cyanobacterium RM2_2_10]